MASPDLKSEGMTPFVEEIERKWKCRHCKHKWPIDNLEAILKPELRPRQCANRKCRAMDWDRPKKKEGRPRKDAKKAKPGRPPKQGKARKSKKRGK